MARGRSETLTVREAQIMDVVWRLGKVTAEQVREGLEGRPHDSTVRTLLRVLESKGYVTHEATGKAYLYSAAVGRQKVQRHALGRVLAQFFGGSAEDLILRLIEDERVTPEQLDELRRAAPATKKPDAGARRAGDQGKGTST